MTVADVRRRQLLAAYENNSGASVAFIDESFLGVDFAAAAKVEPFYSPTAYVVPVVSLEEMRDDLPEVVHGGQRHLTNAHQTDEGRTRILEFVEYVGDGNETIIVAVAQPIDDDDKTGEAAREKCVRALLPALSGGDHCPEIALAIVEERKKVFRSGTLTR